MRAKIVRAWADENKNWSEVFQTQTKEWQDKMGKERKSDGLAISVAILLAAFFVGGVLIRN